MKRILVSGATGFIGGRLVGALLTRGDAVTAFTRGASGERRTPDGVVRFEHWDPRGVEPLALPEADAIVHLAGEPAIGSYWTAARMHEIEASRVESTERLVAAIERAASRPAVLVCSSGVGYYGARDGEPLDESTPPGRDFLAHVTIGWERAAARAESFGVRVVCTRFGVVFGKGGGALTEMVKPFKLFVGGPIGSGKQIVSWIHLDDAVGALLLALDDERLRGPVNVTSPNAVTNRELATAIGRALGRPSALPVPAVALRLRFGEGADPLVTGQRGIPRALTEAGYAFRYPTVGGALDQVLKA